MQLDSYAIITIGILVYLIYLAVVSLFSGKPAGFGKTADLYTPESLTAFSRPCGICELAAAVGLFLYDTETFGIASSNALRITGMVIGAGAIIVLIILFKVMLVRKGRR